jgi:aminoglycoside 3-N-acetyltransferase
MDKPKTLLLETDISSALTQVDISDNPVVLLHISMSAMGWVCGGDVSIINSLINWADDGITIVMPSLTTDYSDPSLWSLPAVPSEWHNIIRKNMPPFIPQQTMTKGIGVVAESFWRHPKVDRSCHPTYSFAAVGPMSSYILHPHDENSTLVTGSPLHRLYQSDAYVLMIGTDWTSCTALHLSEYFSKTAKLIRNGAPVLHSGVRKWVEFTDYDWDEELFDIIGQKYLNDHSDEVRQFTIGEAQCMLLSIKPFVDFATHHLSNAS